MGKSLEDNFKKRFGERIAAVYLDKPLPDQRFQNEKILEAFGAVLSGILKRPLAPEELLGFKGVSLKKRKLQKPLP